MICTRAELLVVVQMAVMTGASLVPVISFGENEVCVSESGES